MNEWEAKVERARLQSLLDAYEADRRHHRAKDRELTPDRADNVRARIARLDQIIGGTHGM
jgi:hypothetical protein